MNGPEIAKLLELLTMQLSAAAKMVEKIGLAYPTVPDAAKALVAQKRCLGCGEIIVGRAYRGLHEAHFKALYRMIKNGTVDEHDAIAL